MTAPYTIGAFAIILDDAGRVLLCHRRDMDLWNPPGGGVESGELPTEAVIREVKEETGLDVTVRRLVGVYSKPDKDDLVFAFVCDVVGGELTVTDESDANRYFALDELPINTMPRQVTRIRDAASNARGPLFKRQTEPASRKWLHTQKRFGAKLQHVLALRSDIEAIHPLLARTYPIAIVENDQFLVFDVNPSSKHYTFVRQAPTPMPVPDGVRAAFPLECYENRTTCIITADAFDSPDGYATIFHEFVHCYQMESCEMRLRETLSIAQKAQATGDFMWEINYPFPYTDPVFEEIYARFLEATTKKQYSAIRQCRKQLRQHLGVEDFEYLIWQEWKEGFARFIENRIRWRLELGENHGGATRPFSRVTFYEGGARLIASLASSQPELATDIEKLFHTINTV